MWTGHKAQKRGLKAPFSVVILLHLKNALSASIGWKNSNVTFGTDWVQTVAFMATTTANYQRLTIRNFFGVYLVYF